MAMLGSVSWKTGVQRFLLLLCVVLSIILSSHSAVMAGHAQSQDVSHQNQSVDLSIPASAADIRCDLNHNASFAPAQYRPASSALSDESKTRIPSRVHTCSMMAAVRADRRQRTAQRRQERAARAVPVTPKPPRPKLVVDGKPTDNHWWKRFPACASRARTIRITKS